MIDAHVFMQRKQTQYNRVIRLRFGRLEFRFHLGTLGEVATFVAGRFSFFVKYHLHVECWARC